MNYSTAVFLINNKVRAIKCVYEEGHAPDVLKTMDPNIKKDDLVIVQTATRHGLTVAKVSEVDVDVDFDSTKEMRWAFSRVDVEAQKGLLEKEQEAIAAIKSAEMRQKRENLRDALFKDQAATLKALPIADMNGQPEE